MLLVQACRSAEQGEHLALVGLAVAADRLAATVAALEARTHAGWVGRLGSTRLGWFEPGLTTEQARTAAAELAGDGAAVAAAPIARTPTSVGYALRDVEAALGERGL